MTKRRGNSTKWKATTTLVAVFILFILYQKGVLSIAFVNGEPVTVQDAALVLLSDDKGLTIKEMVARKVIDIEARRNNVVVTKNEIDAQLDYYRRQAVLQGKTLEQIYLDYGTTRSDVITHAKYRITVYKLFKGDLDIDERNLNTTLEENRWLYELDEEKQIEDKLRDRLFQEKLSEQYDSYIEEANASSEIDYFIKL